MKDVFIVNPKSGRNSQYHLMNEIKEHFQGKRILIEKTKYPGHATKIAKKYARDPSEEIHMYVCGGDGTLHEVVNGIAGCSHIKIAIVPIGTGNDFIKSFPEYMKKDFLDLSRYTKPIEQNCDLIQVNGEYVLNTISFGFDVNVAQNVNKYRQKINVDGIMPYYLGMLASLLRPLGHTYRMIIEDHWIEGEYTFVVFCNGRYYGGGYKPCPKAQINDGKIDVCLIKKVKRSQIVQLAKLYEEGKHTTYSEYVEMYQTDKITLQTGTEALTGNLDGEIRTFKDPVIEIQRDAIHLLLPGK